MKGNMYIEIFNGIASVLGIIGFFLGLYINKNVKRYRSELLEYMDNDFDLKQISDLLECILLFTTCLFDDNRFEKQAYTYILGNCDSYSKFDKRIKKSVKKLKNYDNKGKKKAAKEKYNSLENYYISDSLIIGVILKELTANLGRINGNENRELVRRTK